MSDDEGVATEPEVVDLLSNSDGSFKLGEWEGNAQDFDKSWISQSALQGMREKDKEEVSRQVAAQVDKQQAQFYAQQQAQAMQRAAQQQPQPQQQGNGFQGRLDAIYAASDTQHSGYVHVDQLRQLFSEYSSAVNNEFGSRDRVNSQLAGKLDEWYGQSQERAGTLQSLAGTHADGVWGKFIDTLEKDHPTMPRQMIEAIAAGYEASQGETPDQLRAGISTSIADLSKAQNAHSESARKVKRENAAQLSRVGMPGAAASAVPGKPDKPLTSPAEIADYYFQSGDSAS